MSANAAPSGYYANPAIEVRTSRQDLHDLRFAHAAMGLFFSDWSAGSNLASHIQWVRCEKAVGAIGSPSMYHQLGLVGGRGFQAPGRGRPVSLALAEVA